MYMTIVMSKEWITKPTKMVFATILMCPLLRIYTKFKRNLNQGHIQDLKLEEASVVGREQSLSGS